MNNLELTKWLSKVRDALAEQDEARRNSMLSAADRFLREINQKARAFRRTRNHKSGGGESHGQFATPRQVVESRARN